MTIDFDKVNSWVRNDLIAPQLFSSYVQSKPLLYFISGQNVIGLDKLGDPKAPGIFGGDPTAKTISRKSPGAVAFFGDGVGKATVKKFIGSYERSWRFQSGETDEATAVGLDGNTPAATKYADDLVDRAATRWVDFWAPLSIRKDRVDAAKGDRNAIASIMEDAIAMGFNKTLQKHQSKLYTGTLTEAQQSNELWTDYLGLNHITGDGVANTAYNIYGGKSRTTFPQLRGNVVASGADLGSTVVTLRIPRQVTLLPTLGGTYHSYANAGRLVITTPTLWEKLANDAGDKHRINYSGDKPFNHLLDVGSLFPVICKDNHYIVADPDCPSGCMYILTPEFFLFEIEGNNNFVIEPWSKEWLITKGGKKEMWTNIHAKTRLTCVRPDLQTVVTGLTTS